MLCDLEGAGRGGKCLIHIFKNAAKQTALKPQNRGKPAACAATATKNSDQSIQVLLYIDRK